MTVRFSPAGSRQAVSPEILTQAKRLLASHRKDSPVRSCLSVLCALLPQSVPTADVRQLLRSLSAPGDPVRSITDSKDRWATTMATAHRFLESVEPSSDADVILRRRTARATSLLISLLLPAGGGPVKTKRATEADVAAGRAREVGEFFLVRQRLSSRMEVNVRALVARIGVALLMDMNTNGKGWDTALASDHWIALQLNLSPRHAHTVAKAAVEFGFLKKSSPTSSGVNRYRLIERGTPAQREEITETYFDTIASLAVGRPDLLGELLLAVATPAFAYTEAWQGIRGWWAAFTGLAAATSPLGLPPATAGKLRREVTAAFARAGQPGIGAAALGPQLPVVAETTLATEVFRDAVKRDAERKAALAAERTAFTARRTRTRQIEKMLDEQVFTPMRESIGALPAAGWSNKKVTAWLPKFSQYWTTQVLPRVEDPEVAAVLRKQLINRLRHNKHPYVENFIASIPWPAVLADDPVAVDAA